MITIIGSGPAGISAAYHLKQKGYDFIIIEKQDRIGGLCQSFELGGTIFDLGGHAFFTKHEYIKNLIDQLGPQPLYRQPRSAWVYAFGTYIPYPFQANLYGLPSEIVEECLIGLVKAVREKKENPPHTIEQWIYEAFGEGIAKHFMIPYNTKIWAHPLDQISPNWASDRIVEPDYKSIISGAVKRHDFKDFPNATVAYPVDGGYERIVYYLSKDLDLKQKMVMSEIVSINLEKRQILFSNGKKQFYSKLISTIPLSDLVSKTEDISDDYIQASKELKFFSLYLVNIVIKNTSKVTNMQRIYCSDSHIPFHKLVLNSNSSQYLRQKDTFSIQAEVSFSSFKSVDSSSLMQQVIDSLVEMKIIGHDEDIITSSIVTLPLAYPVYTEKLSSSRQSLLNFYESCGVFCSGRFGEWLYINADDAIMRGKLASEKVMID